MRRLAKCCPLATLIGISVALSLSSSIAQSPNPRDNVASQLWIAEPGDNGLNRWEPRALFEERGVVYEWDSAKIVLLRPGAKTKTTIPGDLVIRIEPGWANQSLENIHRLYSERQYENVVKEGVPFIRNAANTGLPLWQVQAIMAEMVESSQALGKSSNAGILFASFAKDDLPQLLLSTIPLPWGETAFGDADLAKIQSLSEGWLEKEPEAVQLLGAAWLVSGSKRKLAIERLEQLAKMSKSPLVAAFARVQLWRTVPPAEILSDRLPRWLAERDKLLVPMQAGPTMLLAERLQQAGQPSLAIPEWLRVATLHSDRFHLTTKAIAKASAALRSAGRTGEADQVLAMLEPFKTDSQSKK